MTPLGLMAWGIGIVIFDLRIDGFDYLIDVVGWVLCAMAAARLGGDSRWFHVAMWAAIVGGVVSLTENFDVEQSAWLVVPASLAQLVLAWAVCTGIIEKLSESTSAHVEVHRRRAVEANRVRWTVAATFIAISLLAPFMIATSTDVGVGALLPLIIVCLVAYVWFLFLVIRLRGNPSLQGPVHSVVRT